MTAPTGPEGQQQQPDPHAPVDYPADVGLPPPVYPPPYPGYPPPAPGYYPGVGYDPYRQMKPPGTNGKAIASLVCSASGFVCCLPAVPGLILGIAAMRETKRTGQEGYGIALAGTIIGGLMVFGMLLYVVVIIGLIASEWQWA